jgi:hypothetical protein
MTTRNTRARQNRFGCHRSMPGAAVLGVVLGAGSAAMAQCDWFIPDIPDFDQRRLDTPSIAGLPGNGSMYCVPTSSMNLMGFLANHGYPAALGGSHNWQSPGVYDLVTSRITFLGQLMGTTAAGGSNPGGFVSGLTAYLFLYEPGKFDVTNSAVTSGFIPTPADLWVTHQLGALIQETWGRYTESPPGFFTRASGHNTTLIGMTNFCNGTATVWFNNPADDPADTTQSNFTYAHSRLVPVTGFFRSGSTQAYAARTMYRFADVDNQPFFDNYGATWGAFAIVIGNSAGGPPELQVQRPIQILGLLPAVQHFQTPTGGAIRDVAMQPRMESYYYITGPVGATPVKVFRLDAAGGGSTETTGFSAPTRLYFGRHGALYVLDGDTLSWTNPEAPPSSVGQGGSTASLGIDCVTYADSNDVVVGLDVAGRTVHVWTQALTGTPATLAIPPGPCISGRSSIVVSPVDGSLWICSGGCPAIYKFTGTPLTVADTINLAAGSNPTGLNVDRAGHVFFSSGGLVHEMEKTNGLWIDSPGSSFAGIAAGAVFCLSRSRTNFDAATMSGPEWNNLDPPGTAPEIAYHCSADFDCDGDIGTDADIEAFFACLAGNCPPLPCLHDADYNGDGDTGTDADIESFFRVLAGGPC